MFRVYHENKTTKIRFQLRPDNENFRYTIIIGFLKEGVLTEAGAITYLPYDHNSLVQFPGSVSERVRPTELVDRSLHTNNGHYNYIIIVIF